MEARSFKIKAKVKSQIKKIVWITLLWTLYSIFKFFTGYTTLKGFNVDFSNLNPVDFLKGSIFIGIVAGLFGGSLIVIFWSKWLRTKSYGWSLLNIFWSYTVLYILVLTLSGLFSPELQRNTSFIHLNALQRVWSEISSISFIQNYLSWLMMVIFTLIALLVNDKYGPGVFASFLLGKYFHPKREERIFMFLDLRGATTIAEKLGESRYFDFMKDVFRESTPEILKSKGEIYQYVGDEIIVSWKKEAGTQDANCLQCFFDIQKRFLDNASYYQENYDGIVPEFKAGLHFGSVMVGEVGVVKRDIAYSGDVLNTAARIESKCNELGVNILFSKDLLIGLKSLPNQFKPSEIGEIDLRGKQNSLMLYTV
ncbi:MAG: adenylate/guanylate cyclase domain-containing protein [Crocinitomicaceae bacterium]|nr:adenylate/guanylate cyclase domain-containing protein [Crocinitomicaceae bacterium]